MCGFSLVELLIALAIIAMLAALLFPGMRGLAQRDRLARAQHALIGSLALTRSLALEHGRHLLLCPSADGLNCTHDQPWERGWLVGHAQRINAHDNYQLLDLPVHVQSSLHGVHLLAGRVGQPIVFQSDGGTAGSNVSFVLCTGDRKVQARRVVLALSGRTRTEIASIEQAEACRQQMR